MPCSGQLLLITEKKSEAGMSSQLIRRPQDHVPHVCRNYYDQSLLLLTKSEPMAFCQSNEVVRSLDHDERKK